MIPWQAMSLSHEIRRRLKHIVPPVLGTLVVVYFAFHALHGERGFFAYLQLKNEIRKAELTRDLFAGERAILERRTVLLHPDRMDGDMLEERARAMLNVLRPDERVILLDPPKARNATLAE